MSRQSVSSGSPYEESIGFTRAVRIGDLIAVSGTAPIAEGGGCACPGDLYGQTLRCLEIARQAIEDLGGSLSDVYRTRIMLTDISRWEDAGRAHGDVFRTIKPASTFVEVKGLIRPEWLVEIEVDAKISTGT